MAVNEDDVRHVAELARLRLDHDRIGALVQELNGILAHMDVLATFEMAGKSAGAGHEGRSEEPVSLRPDAGPQIPLAGTRSDFAPGMRDGFFLVPRLATHGEDAAEGEHSP